MLSGVSGGIAEYLNIDVTLVRLGFVGLTLITGGAALLGYAIAWIVIPESDGKAVWQNVQESVNQQNHSPEADIASRIYDDTKTDNKPPAA